MGQFCKQFTGVSYDLNKIGFHKFLLALHSMRPACFVTVVSYARKMCISLATEIMFTFAFYPLFLLHYSWHCKK
jgi:hypothetical protein